MRILHWVAALILSLPSAASAHAFGQQFTLPLPVDFYITGGVCAFIASCSILLLFSDPVSKPLRAIRGEFALPQFIKIILGGLGLGGFVFSLALAYLGSQSFVSNPLPDLFWIIFLLVFTYFTMLVGGLWPHLDPFRRIAQWLSSDVENAKPPLWLPYLPSLLLIALLTLELYSSGLGAIPIVVGTLLVFIATLSVIGSTMYGFKTWYENGDLFNSFFALFSSIAPIQIIDGRLYLYVPGERLVRESAGHISVLFFTLILLGSTILDGLRETKIWYEIMSPIPYTWDNYIGVALLVLVPILLFTFYALSIHLLKKITRSPLSANDLRLRFAYSLIPIAAAYHFAHYFSLILSQGQTFIASISDPFNKGWDIFGTADYQMNIGLVGADTVWYMQLSAIVIGHVLAAIVAHRIAQRAFHTRRSVLLSQLPMLVLMVGLTWLGLWTLSQPFVL